MHSRVRVHIGAMRGVEKDMPKTSDKKECPYCEFENYMVASKCEACGYMFYRMCPECGKPSWSGDAVCIYCEVPFKKYCPKCGTGALTRAQICEHCEFVFMTDEDREGLEP